jgi:ubiquinone/menaquinone biosynthesis C-methylase UbiE
MSTPGSAHNPNPGAIIGTLFIYQRSLALKAAIELDVFTEIAKGNHTVEQIAKAVNATPRGVRILCDYLTTCEFLTKDGNRYTSSPDAAVFLDKNSPAYLGSASKFLVDPELIAPYYQLADIIKSGFPNQGTVSPDNPIWVEFAESMAPMMFTAGKEIAAIVAGDKPIKVLDIAAGHGLFGVLVAQQNPQAQLTALDWANVLAVARKNADKMGVGARVSLLPGDAFTTDFGGPYDLILVTNFLHHFDIPACEGILRKIHKSLAPGGRCATLEFVPNEDRVSPPMPAQFAMMMLGSTQSGDAYTFNEYQKMFANSGFAYSVAHPLQASAETLIVSTKG